jgi:large subunit ribosomal protein L29
MGIVMKAKEIRELSQDELSKAIGSLEEELFNLRFQARLSQLTNPLRMRVVKRDIARYKTVLNEKKIA